MKTVIAAVIGVVVVTDSMSDLDLGACNDSIDRFTMFFFEDHNKLQQLTKHTAWTKTAVETVMDPNNETAFETFVYGNLNSSIVYDEFGKPAVDENGKVILNYNSAVQINFWAMIDNETFETIWSVYYPAEGNLLAGNTPTEPAPVIPPEFFKETLKEVKGPEDILVGWVRTTIPDVVTDPMIVSFEAIMMPDDRGVVSDYTVYGYLVAGRTLQPRMSLYADGVPGCISLVTKKQEFGSL